MATKVYLITFTDTTTTQCLAQSSEDARQRTINNEKTRLASRRRTIASITEAPPPVKAPKRK